MKLLCFETFMYYDGLALCDVYVLKLLRYGTITICDATFTVCRSTIPFSQERGRDRQIGGNGDREIKECAVE
jgi:hypothetical protein